MAKNHMDEVAKMLGVELGEEFQISGQSKDDRYFIDNDGLNLRYGGQDCYAQGLLGELLNGKKEIVRRPWMPKDSEKYWFVYCRSDGGYDITWNVYSESSRDLDHILMGDCFPSKEAAKAAAPEIVRMYKEIWSEIER